EAARESIARFVGAEAPERVVFTKGGTEAINLVAAGLGQSLRPGDEILVSQMEHHSNIVPWHLLRERQHAADVVAAGQLRHHAAVGLVHLHLAVQGVRQQHRHARAGALHQRHAGFVAGRFDAQDHHGASLPGT
ncbi:aminotransferase class V-fold PLP-dependent enzyme, partial [Klebsiella pneumoniae]|nr:aminotransferase class V-fold PLP-dependent enzyme [Klebsiella pneumoniae]